MRAVLLLLLLSGCTAIDKLADSGPNYVAQNRVFLGSESIEVPRSENLDRYTCGRQVLLCKAWGSNWSCYCSGVQY
ncbi:MAG TPA: hypothetical protein VGC50_16290 [Gammaproteobacteria bacterium]|jgi:hypothetical protein